MSQYCNILRYTNDADLSAVKICHEMDSKADEMKAGRIGCALLNGHNTDTLVFEEYHDGEGTSHGS